MGNNKDCSRKNPWRFLFLGMAVYGGIKLLGGLWIDIMYWFSVLFMKVRSEFVPGEAYSVGIIGGANGPTAVFLTAPVWVCYLIPVIMLVVGIFGYLRLSGRKSK